MSIEKTILKRIDSEPKLPIMSPHRTRDESNGRGEYKSLCPHKRFVGVVDEHKIIGQLVSVYETDQWQKPIRDAEHWIATGRIVQFKCPQYAIKCDRMKDPEKVNAKTYFGWYCLITITERSVGHWALVHGEDYIFNVDNEDLINIQNEGIKESGTQSG